VALRSVLAYAVRNGWLDANPADALTSRERPKSGASSRRFLTEEEMARLLDAAEGRDRVLIAVCLFGGLRISEVLGLTWDDVDLQPATCASATSSTGRGSAFG
jgi:integrase